ncbi:MAG: tetratricopeptide repeat protein [Anaerolineales bacterium]|nr:tetratricopeptide repeat protein [Anaerolineales bacterium]
MSELMQNASSLLSKGRANEALPILNQAHQQFPSDPDVALNLGGAFIMLQQHDQAIPILEQAALLAPENSKIWINLGAAYLGKLEDATNDNREKAIKAFEKALELDPAAPSVNYNLGLIHRERGALDIAIIHFRRAAAINPFDHDARRILERLRNKKAQKGTAEDGEIDG